MMIAVGVAAIGGGAYAAWDLSSKVGDLQGAIGKVEGVTSVQSQLQDISNALKKLNTLPTAPEGPAPTPKMPDKQGALEPTPSEFPGWTGVRAPTAQDLAKALPAAPEKSGPVWVFTPDQSTADALKKYLP